MENKNLIEQIQLCTDCLECLEECDTYQVTHDLLKSPNGRLKIVEKIFQNKNITSEEIIALYTCTLCELCDLACKNDIPIANIIHHAKVKLVELNKAPLEIHNEIIKDIIEKDNSVKGNPDERLEWIPEKFKSQENFESTESDTLLFLGCMSSFRVRESASASYELLKMGGYDFKILEREPCCGEYVYSAGNLELAKKIFNDNYKKFKALGIKSIITTCGGCLYAYNNVYPKYIEGWDIDVKHVIQVIYELFHRGKIKFSKLKKEITYHDPCRLGRKLNSLEIYDEPRELLTQTSQKINELSNNKDTSPCCGAGSGIRGVDSSISIKIGSKILEQAPTEEIITSCPLCVFNYRYVNYKTQNNKKIRYITDFLLETIK
ncbi:MAG: (Fe-S)-binding protein [Promethearchaeota archaeon]